ncbi:MAG: hypothetical protein IPH07_24660 [Deltaproteobacteria bacterium]|nr:hypothetical protein [Deltaproteobacteria bacterium]
MLGRAGADAIPFLKDLAEAGLEGARVTAEQAKQADALEKAYLRLQYEAGMAKTQLASEFIPVLLEIVQQFNQARQAGFDFADALGSAFKGPEQAAADAAKELGKLTLMRAELARKVETGDTSIWDFVLGSPADQDERLRSRMEVAAQQLDRWVKVLNRRADDAARQIATDQLSIFIGPKPEAPRVDATGAVGGAAKDPNAAILREIESLRERATQVGINSAYEKALYEVQAGRFAASAKWAQQELLMSALIIDAKKREVDVEKDRIDMLEEEAAAERRAWGSKSAREVADDDLRARLQAVNSLASRSDRARVEEAERLQADMTDLLERGLIQPETWSRAFGVVEAMKQTKDEMAAGFQELIKSVDGWGKQTSQAFADWLFGGSGSLKDVVIRGSKEIVAAVAYQQFFKGAGETAVGSILDMIRYMRFGDSAQDVAGVLGSGIMPKQLASGGDYAGGRAILVGERGPELMVPRTAGTVVPNHALGGGPVFNNTIVIQGGASRAQVERGLADMQRAVVGIVSDATARGMLGTSA